MYSIPIAFITSNITTDPNITSFDLIVHKLSTSSNHNDLKKWFLNKDQNIMIFEMIRVHALNKNITNLSDLHNLWIDLGYSSSDNGILFGFNDDTQPLNAKISMLLNTKIQGIVAYCPLGIWNIINKNKKE